MHEIFSRIVRIYSQSCLIKFALLVYTSRPVGQSGHCRQWEEPKREPLLSRAIGFPNPGGGALWLSSLRRWSRWHGEPLRRRAGRPVWRAPGQRAAEDRRGKCTGTESAPSLLLTWRGDVDVSTAGCGNLPSKLKLEPLLRRLKDN